MESVFREIATFEGEDGLEVLVSRWPARQPGATRLLALHGFIGSGADFQPVADHLQGAAEVVAPDLLGHGGSAAPEALPSYGLDAQLARLDALLGTLPPRPTVVMGYSMGGRLALHWALRCQGRLDGLVLIGATPGLRSDEERDARRGNDEALARGIEAHGVVAFLEDWYRLSIISTQDRIPGHYLETMRERRRHNRPQGLAQSLRAVGQGALDPLWDRLGELQVPTFLVTGAEDEKYARLAFWMNLALPRCWHQSIPAAGHSPHLEAPAVFARLLLGWLQSRGLVDVQQATGPGV